MKRSKVYGTLFLIIGLMLVLTCCALKVPHEGGAQYSGGSNNEQEQEQLTTDSFITVDGKLDEEVWQNKKSMYIEYGDVQMNVTTTLGKQGFYVAYDVRDKRLYAVEGREDFHNACIEMYFDRGNATAKTEQTRQYRLSLIGQRGYYTGYASPYVSGYAWTQVGNMHIMGQTVVEGELNSGNTQGFTGEIFVRWDVLGYDWLAEDFEVPETIKLLPVYNRSSGASLSDTREIWLAPTGAPSQVQNYYLFGEEGYVLADRDGAVVGDSAFGRVKTPGWDISGEAEGEVRSNYQGDQYIYFTDVKKADYAVTALVRFDGALGGSASPKAGLLLGADGITLYSFMIDFSAAGRQHPNGRLLERNVGSYSNREIRAFGEEIALGDIDVTEGVRLTGVKRGNHMYVSAGNADTGKFDGGTLLAVFECGEVAGEATPGFMAIGCSAVFTDYEYSDSADKIAAILGEGITAVNVEQKPNGAITGYNSEYLRGATATFRLQTYSGYRLQSLTVNGEDVLSSDKVQNGVLTLHLTEERYTVVPTFEKIAEKLYPVSGTVLLDSDMLSSRVSILLRAENDNSLCLRVSAGNSGAFAANLPNGEYIATIAYENGLSKNVKFAVTDAPVTLGEVSLQVAFGPNGNSTASGTWIVGENEVRVSSASTTNNCAIFLKESGSARQYIFEVTVHIGAAWQGDPDPKVGIIMGAANGRHIVLGVHAVAGNVQNKWNIFNPIDWDGWSRNGTYTQGSDKNTVTLKVVRYSNYFYAFVNGEPVMMTTESFLRGTGSMVGLHSLASLSTFTDWSYTEDATAVKETLDEALCAFKTRVNEPKEGGSVTSEAVSERVVPGSNVNVTFTANEGYYIQKVELRRGAAGAELTDVTELLSGNVLTVTNVRTEVAVFVTYAKTGELYEVSGKVDFGNLYHDENDTVTLTAGIFKGAVDASGNFSVKLPSGNFALEFSTERYRNVRLNVTVEDAPVSALRASFARPALASYADVTDDGTAYTVLPQNRHRELTKAITVSASGNAFAVYATLTQATNDSQWQAGGFTVISGDTQYDFTFWVNKDTGAANIFVVNNTAWYWQLYGSQVRFTGVTPLNGMRVGLLHKDGVYYACIEEQLVCVIDKDTEPQSTDGDTAKPESFSKLFAATQTKKLGIKARNIAASFADISYTFDAAAVTGKLDAMYVTVDTSFDAGLGSVTLSATRVLQNTPVTVSITPNDSVIIKRLTVGGEEISGLTGDNGVYSYTFYPSANTTVAVDLEEVEALHTVSGTFEYPQNQYTKKTDAVTVSAGSVTGEANNTGFSILLPKGTHTLTFTHVRFKDVTVQVTVGNEDLSEQTVAFTTVKFEDYTNITENPDGSITLNGTNKFAYFNEAGTTSHPYFAVWAKMKSEGNTGGWRVGGIAVKVGTKTNVAPTIDKRLFYQTGGRLTVHGGPNYGNQGYADGDVYPIGEYYDVLMIYDKVKPYTLYYMVNGYLTVIDGGTVPTGVDNDWSKLEDRDLFKVSSRKLGLFTVDCSYTYKDFGYSLADVNVVNALIASCKRTVTADYDAEQGTVRLSETNPLQSKVVTVTVTPAAGKVLSELKVGDTTVAGTDITLNNGVYTYSFRVNGDTTVSVLFADSYEVSGTLSYASGLYGTGDTVSVGSGSFAGEVNGTAWKISLPTGTHALTFVSSRFVDVTQSVTVENSAVNAGQVQFTRVKLADMNGITDNGSEYRFGTQTTKLFANASTTAENTAFYAEAKMSVDWAMTGDGTRLGSEWQAAGFRIQAGNNDYAISYYVNGVDAWIFIVNQTTWKTRLFVKNNMFADSVDIRNPFKIGLLYKDGVYTALINDTKVMDINAENAVDSEFNGMFDTAVTRTLGIRARDKAAGFTDIAYTFDTAEIEQKSSALQ